MNVGPMWTPTNTMNQTERSVWLNKMKSCSKLLDSVTVSVWQSNQSVLQTVDNKLLATWFASTVFSDYFSAILGLVRQGSSWSLNPFGVCYFLSFLQSIKWLTDFNIDV